MLHTEVFSCWFETELTQDQQDALIARVDLLKEHGPTLGRPTVDSIEHSRHQN